MTTPEHVQSDSRQLRSFFQCQKLYDKMRFRLLLSVATIRDEARESRFPSLGLSSSSFNSFIDSTVYFAELCLLTRW